MELSSKIISCAIFIATPIANALYRKLCQGGTNSGHGNGHTIKGHLNTPLVSASTASCFTLPSKLGSRHGGGELFYKASTHNYFAL